MSDNSYVSCTNCSPTSFSRSSVLCDARVPAIQEVVSIFLCPTSAGSLNGDILSEFSDVTLDSSRELVNLLISLLASLTV